MVDAPILGLRREGGCGFRQRYRNIWLVGGALLGQPFLERALVDDIILTIAPALLGDGLRLFSGLPKQEQWALKNVVAYRNGYVELTYSAIRG